jgi:hypothetical protein
MNFKENDLVTIKMGTTAHRRVQIDELNYQMQHFRFEKDTQGKIFNTFLNPQYSVFVPELDKNILVYADDLRPGWHQTGV